MPQFTGQVNVVCPQSRSYLRILDMPRWYTTSVETTVTQVEAVLRALPMCHLFQLVDPIRLVNNSPSSDMKTVYLEVWDSKAGSAFKELIRRTVQFGKYACCIVKGEAIPGTPLWMRCWCWCHPFFFLKKKKSTIYNVGLDCSLQAMMPRLLYKYDTQKITTSPCTRFSITAIVCIRWLLPHLMTTG
jgi:hypothetical protein